MNFFVVLNIERNVKLMAARLPYFDGAYWLGAADDVIQYIENM